MHSANKKRRSLVAAALCSLVASSCALVLLPSAPSLFAQRRARPTPKVVERPKAQKTPAQKATPSPTSTPRPAATGAEARAADALLGRAVARLLDEGDFADARWGVSVVSLRDGRTLFERNARRLITPASNMKLYTTAAALDLLGADYRWRTSVYSAAEPARDGTVAGDLTLYGRGAPDLASRIDKKSPVNHLAQLADALYRRGVRRVGGDVVGDESFFRGDPHGDGWQWGDVQWYYGAEVSALSVDDNEITLEIASADKAGERTRLKLTPETDYVRLTNDMNTVERGARSTLGVTRALSSNDVRVWGDFPAGASPYSVHLSVHQPALWAARLFREALAARGIKVEGRARSRDARVSDAERFDPEGAVELAHVLSRTLGEVVRKTNKESLNLQAELILRTLGRERGDQLAPVQDPQRARARDTDKAGTAVLRRWLEDRAGVETDALALHDGSGLSRLNLVTPDSMTRLLARMAQSPAAGVFRDSLPRAAEDGTLRGRMRNAAGRVAAKTGTLTYIDSLSGYATTADGEPLAFAVFCNDDTERAPSRRVIDAITLLLANYSSR